MTVFQIAVNKVSNTGAATDIETQAFNRQALGPAATALGKGTLVLHDKNGRRIVLTATDLRLIAMGKKEVPKDVDERALALFCDDLASQTKPEAIKNQEVNVDIEAAGLSGKDGYAKTKSVEISVVPYTATTKLPAPSTSLEVKDKAAALKLVIAPKSIPDGEVRFTNANGRTEVEFTVSQTKSKGYRVGPLRP